MPLLQRKRQRKRAMSKHKKQVKKGGRESDIDLRFKIPDLFKQDRHHYFQVL